jgi:ornithine cyclodeaminase
MPRPLELYLPDRDGELHVKGACLLDAPVFAVKSVSGFYRNSKLGLPVGDGMTMVHDARTGMLRVLILDGGLLTELRTAAAGALAADMLARPDAQTVAVIGAGSQARYQLQALLEVRQIREVAAYSRRREATDQYADDMSRLGVHVVARNTVSEAVAGADIVITATTSTRPLLHAEWLAPGTHVTAVGSDMPHKQELDPGVLAAADKYVPDSIEAAARSGELHHAIDSGVLDVGSVYGELAAVASGRLPGRERDDELTVADLTGLGIQDAAVAAFVTARAEELRAGTDIVQAGDLPGCGAEAGKGGVIDVDDPLGAWPDVDAAGEVSCHETAQQPAVFPVTLHREGRPAVERAVVVDDEQVPGLQVDAGGNVDRRAVQGIDCVLGALVQSPRLCEVAPEPRVLVAAGQDGDRLDDDGVVKPRTAQEGPVHRGGEPGLLEQAHDRWVKLGQDLHGRAEERRRHPVMVGAQAQQSHEIGATVREDGLAVQLQERATGDGLLGVLKARDGKNVLDEATAEFGAEAELLADRGDDDAHARGRIQAYPRSVVGLGWGWRHDPEGNIPEQQAPETAAIDTERQQLPPYAVREARGQHLRLDDVLLGCRYGVMVTGLLDKACDLLVLIGGDGDRSDASGRNAIHGFTFHETGEVYGFPDSRRARRVVDAIGTVGVQGGQWRGYCSQFFHGRILLVVATVASMEVCCGEGWASEAAA